MNRSLELAQRSWETVPNRTKDDDDIAPCSEVSAYSSVAECEQALMNRTACRRRCVARLACDHERLSAVGDAWAARDPKRDPKGYDLLPKYFYFPPDITVDALDSSAAGQWRLPTYKRLQNADVKTCREKLQGVCKSHPCLAVTNHGGDMTACEAHMNTCFAGSAKTKTDILPSNDPLAGKVTDSFVQPQIGWLDSFGYSKGIQADVIVNLFQDRPRLTFGDHGAFVAAVFFKTTSCGRKNLKCRNIQKFAVTNKHLDITCRTKKASEL